MRFEKVDDDLLRAVEHEADENNLNLQEAVELQKLFTLWNNRSFCALREAFKKVSLNPQKWLHYYVEKNAGSAVVKCLGLHSGLAIKKLDTEYDEEEKGDGDGDGNCDSAEISSLNTEVGSPSAFMRVAVVHGEEEEEAGVVRKREKKFCKNIFCVLCCLILYYFI